MADPKAVRIRLRDDFPFYASRCVSIRPKVGPVALMKLNGPQRKLLAAIDGQIEATGRVRIIILKARQQGFSTFVHAYIYWRLSQHKAKKGLVVAHVADSTRALFDMYRRTHDLMPPLMKPSTKYSSRKELSFNGLDTSLMVSTAGGDSIGRGETYTHAHLSEVAFWPPATAADNLNGLLAATRASDVVFIESTANGMTGPFRDVWLKALSGENEYLAFFSPWFDSEEYAVECAPFEHTYEEEDLIKAYGLSDEQLMFRRRVIAESGREKFQQEYPSNAEEAFLASGRPVFNPDQLHEALAAAEEPLFFMANEASTFKKHPRGELSVYKKRKLTERYFIGADVAMGIKGGDYSVAQVLDSQKNQVAVWRGHVHPDYFANVLYDLGIYYNEARLAVESNNHGLLTAIRLGRDLAYPNVYTEMRVGELADHETLQIGFQTTSKSKPMIIDQLRAAMREKEMTVNDKTTLREMLSFVVSETGRMAAEEGLHDDCVMALAIANFIHDGKFTPIIVTDDYYVDAL